MLPNPSYLCTVRTCEFIYPPDILLLVKHIPTRHACVEVPQLAIRFHGLPLPGQLWWTRALNSPHKCMLAPTNHHLRHISSREYSSLTSMCPSKASSVHAVPFAGEPQPSADVPQERRLHPGQVPPDAQQRHGPQRGRDGRHAGVHLHRQPLPPGPREHPDRPQRQTPQGPQQQPLHQCEELPRVPQSRSSPSAPRSCPNANDRSPHVCPVQLTLPRA